MNKAILLLVSLFLLSCIKKPEYQPQTTVVTYSFTAGTDMDKLFGFTASYIDKDNNPVQEQITSLPWNKQITAELPFNAHLEVDFSAKDQFPDQASYKVGFKGNITQSDVSTPVAKAIESKAVANDGKLRFSVTLPSGVSPDDVNLSIAPLKYNKHFAFTFTVDDTYENAWSRIFPLVHQKWIDDMEFFHLRMQPTTGYVPANTLCVTDGCGNDRRFGFGVAIWPNLRDDYHPNGRISESSTSKTNIYITWEELRVMLDFGCSVYFHNVDETKYDKNDPVQIAQGFQDDYNKVVEKLGRKMKVLALPDGNKAYLAAAANFPQIAFTRNSLAHETLIYLNNKASLKGKETYGGQNTSDVNRKLDELAQQAASDNPYWAGLTVHRASQEHMDLLAKVYNLYGKAGTDNIWVASWDEVYEYQEFRNESTISKSVDGQQLTFEVTLPDQPDFTFRDLSFVLDGVNTDCSVTPLSDNIYGLSHAAQNGGGLLVNVNFNPASLERAEKYTAKYEASASETDKDDARYFASMLLPELAAPFIDRIENRKDRPILHSITIDEGANTVYNPSVKITLETSGNPTVYRIGETADLSAAAWKSYSPEIAYTLSPDFGKKTIFAQVGNGTFQSEVVSASVSYVDVPASGTISRQAVKAYQTKYNGHKVSVDKQIKRSK